MGYACALSDIADIGAHDHRGNAGFLRYPFCCLQDCQGDWI